MCLSFIGFRASSQTVHAEHGVEVLQEHQPRMETPGVTLYLMPVHFMNLRLGRWKLSVVLHYCS